MERARLGVGLPAKPQPLLGSTQTTADTQVRFRQPPFSTLSTPSHFWQKAQKPATTDEKRGHVLNCGIWGLDKNGDAVARLMATS
jgi:hypothetical protein